VVRRDEPQRRFLHTAASRVERKAEQGETPERFTFFTLGRVGLIGAIVLFVLFLVGSGHLIKQLHREAGVSETPAPSAVETAAPSPTSWITADMLRVTSISLGDIRLAVVNGKRLAEGDSLDLKTPAGVVTVRVMSIEDGVVHFVYKDQTLDAKLTAPSSATKSP